MSSSIRRNGAQAQRLAANDPPACSGKVEPRRQQPLAQVVAGPGDRRQQDLLLDDLLVEPVRVAARDDVVERPDEDRSGVAALHHRGCHRDQVERRARHLADSTPPSICGTSRRAVSTRRLPGTISTFRSSSIDVTIDAPPRADRAKLRSAIGHGIPDQTQGAGRDGDPPHPAAAARARGRRRHAIETAFRKSVCTRSGPGSSDRARRWS